MLSTFFYAQDNKLSKDEFADSFLKLMVARSTTDDTEHYDEDADPDAALQGLVTVIHALWPSKDKKTGETRPLLKGEEAEKVFRDAWVISYALTLKRRGFPIPNPLDGGTGEFNPKDEKQVHDFIEAGNSPDWDNPVANGDIEMPRWLILKAAQVQGEIDADRTAEFYRYARKRDAEKNADETRDPETKGDPA